ncbi:hypothetical protein AB1Y20_000720 [Prymnesium parvum]|uniref:Dephospho-CoA kinase n=1 Tax=Prymnesium parvum TaxID=97485 RepID=A0AB34KAC7_PRYPA
MLLTALAAAARPVVIGVTGSIGMGKSTATKWWRRLGIRVHDADACVHQLYASGGAAVPAVGAAFPGTLAADGSVDRQRLSAALLSHEGGREEGLRALEAIVHPLVEEDRRRLVREAGAAGEWLVVVDIPLLYETHASEAELRETCDAVVVVSAPAETQRERVLRRGGMTAEKFEFIVSQQLPDAEKRKRADFVIDTGYATKAMATAQLAACHTALMARFAAPYGRWLRGGGGGGLKCVTLDLDDTLWPVMPPILAAQTALLDAIRTHLPKSHAAGLADRQALAAAMAPMRERHPMLAHDLTELRRLALAAAAAAHGDDAAGVDAAMEAFLEVRSDVAAHLFADVRPAIERLRAAGLAVGAITNGNCDVERSLGALFDFSVTAGGAGAAKPDPIPFLQAAGLAGCHPREVVHVGDAPTADLCGALRLGMRAILLTRPEIGARSPDEQAAIPPRDDARWRELTSMTEVVDVILNDPEFCGRNEVDR